MDLANKANSEYDSSIFDVSVSSNPPAKATFNDSDLAYPPFNRIIYALLFPYSYTELRQYPLYSRIS
ncbi:MAG: hypothetical protein EZS28_026161 [Streblomastix strix]|uniref:Uncharacterized protein n=1 Tax=Streblomastix strix TaxID=222440 RepID=A0A5J4V7S2_9EUKA|nr:MAG: hypothetical protein EZS28_026161 [Streblomastix strix]